MFNIILFCFLLFILFLLLGLTYHFRTLSKERKLLQTQIDAASAAILNDEDSLEKSHGFIYAAIVLATILLLTFAWFIMSGSPWQAHLMEWLNIIIRLMHITFGIAWIGASFYFVFLENALNRTENVRDELAGNLWAVHGGGFYYLEKHKIAPKELPKTLHWFKYEAYFTWLSGFSLLFVVYYFNTSAFLVDKSVMDLSSWAATAIGVGSLVAGWFIYHLLCKTPIVKNGPLFACIGLLVATAFAFFYTHVFSGRGAYIHFGAMLGTLMAGNVFFIIIPSQKAMVNAAKKGILPDAALGKSAGLRSLHNNYLTLPVLFVMISNHFPSTFGFKYPWLILAIITLGTAGVKHWLNLREKGQLNVWVLPVSVIILFAAAYISAPSVSNRSCSDPVSFAEVNQVVQRRCVSCHSSRPTDDVFSAPPNGVVYDTPHDIVKLKDKIMQRVVITNTMPQNNKTNMTQEERDLVECWIKQGASVK